MTKLPEIVEFGPPTAVPVLQFNPPTLKFEQMPTSPPVFKNQPVIQFTPNKVNAPERFTAVYFDLPDFPSMIKPDSVQDGDFYKDFAKDLVLKQEKAKKAEELEKNSVPDPIHPGKRVVNIVKYEEMTKASPRSLYVQTDAPALQPKAIKTATVPIEVIKAQRSDVSSDSAQFGIFDAEAQRELQQMGYDVKEQNTYNLKDKEYSLAVQLGVQRGYLLLSEAGDIGHLAKQITTQSSYYVAEQAPVLRGYNYKRNTAPDIEQNNATAQRIKPYRNEGAEPSIADAYITEITIQAPKTIMPQGIEAEAVPTEQSFIQPSVYAFQQLVAELPLYQLTVKKAAEPYAEQLERPKFAFAKESSVLQPLFAKKQQNADVVPKQAANEQQIAVAEDARPEQRAAAELNNEAHILHEFSGDAASQPFSEQFLAVEAFKQTVNESAAIGYNAAVRRVYQQQDVAFQLPEVTRRTVLPEHDVLQAKGVSAPALQNVKTQFAEAVYTARSSVQIAEGTVRMVQTALKQPPKESARFNQDEEDKSDAEYDFPQQRAVVYRHTMTENGPEKGQRKAYQQKYEFPALQSDLQESSAELRHLAFRPTKDFPVFASDAFEVPYKQQVAQELHPTNNLVSPSDYYQSTRFARRTEKQVFEQEELDFTRQEAVARESLGAETQPPAFKEQVVLLPGQTRKLEGISDYLDSRIVTFRKKAYEGVTADETELDVHRSPGVQTSRIETPPIYEHFPMHSKNAVSEFNSPLRIDAKKAATPFDYLDFETQHAYINYYQASGTDFVSFGTEITRKYPQELQLGYINVLLRSVQEIARSGLSDASYNAVELHPNDPQRTIYAKSPLVDAFTDLTQYITRETTKNAAEEEPLFDEVEQRVKMVKQNSDAYGKEALQQAEFVVLKERYQDASKQHSALAHKVPVEKQKAEGVPIAGAHRVYSVNYQNNDFLGDYPAVYRQNEPLAEQVDELAAQRLKSERVQYMGKTYNFVDLKRVLSKQEPRAEIREDILAAQAVEVYMLSPQCLNVEAQQIKQQRPEPAEETGSSFAELIGNAQKRVDHALSPHKSNTVETLEIQKSTPKQFYTEESQQDVVLSRMKNHRDAKAKEKDYRIGVALPNLPRKAISAEYSPQMLTAGMESDDSVPEPCPAKTVAVKKAPQKANESFREPQDVLADFYASSKDSSKTLSVKSLSVDYQMFEQKDNEAELFEFRYMNAKHHPQRTAKTAERKSEDAFLGVETHQINVRLAEDPLEILDACAPTVTSRDDAGVRFEARELTTKRRIEKALREQAAPESEESSEIVAQALNIDREVLKYPASRYSSDSDYEPQQCSIKAERAIQYVFRQVQAGRRAENQQSDGTAELYADRLSVKQSADERQDYVDVQQADRSLENEHQNGSQDSYGNTARLTRTKANGKPRNIDEIRLSDDVAPVGYTKLQKYLQTTRNTLENPPFKTARARKTGQDSFEQEQEVLNTHVVALQREPSLSDAVDRIENARRVETGTKPLSPEPVESLSTIDFQTEFSTRQDEGARAIGQISPEQEFGHLNARRRYGSPKPVEDAISSAFSLESICNFAKVAENPTTSAAGSSSQQSDLIQDAALRQRLQTSDGSDANLISTFDQMARPLFPSYESGVQRPQHGVPAVQKQAQVQPPLAAEQYPQSAKLSPQPAVRQLYLIDHFGSSDFSDPRQASALSSSGVELSNALFTAAAASRSSQPDGPTRFVSVYKYEPFKIAAHSAGKLSVSKQEYSDEYVFLFAGQYQRQTEPREQAPSAYFSKAERQEANSLDVWRAAPTDAAGKQTAVGMQSPLTRAVKSEEEQRLAGTSPISRYSKPQVKAFVPMRNPTATREQATSASGSSDRQAGVGIPERLQYIYFGTAGGAGPAVSVKSTSVSRHSDSPASLKSEAVSLESSCQQIYPNDVVVQSLLVPIRAPEEYQQSLPLRQPIAAAQQKTDYPEQNAGYSMVSELSSYQDLGVFPQRMIPLQRSVQYITQPSAFVFVKRYQQPLSESQGRAIPQEQLSEVHVGELGVFKKVPDAVRAINLVSYPVYTDSVHLPANAEAQTSHLSESLEPVEKEAPAESPLQREWQYIQEHLDQYPFFVTRYQLCGKCQLRREQGSDKMVETAKIEEPAAVPLLATQATETVPLEAHDTSVQLSSRSEREERYDQEVQAAGKRIVERQLPCLIVYYPQDEPVELVDKSVQQSAAVLAEPEDRSVHPNIVNFVRPQPRMPPRAPERPLIVNEVALVLPAKRVPVREFKPKQVVTADSAGSTGLSSQTASSSDSYFYSSYSSATESGSSFSESPRQISQISRKSASERPSEPLRTHSSQIQSVSLSSGPYSQTPGGKGEEAAEQEKSAASVDLPRAAVVAEDKLDWKQLIEESLQARPSGASLSSSSTSLGQVYPKVHSSQLRREEQSFSAGEVHPIREKGPLADSSALGELSDGEIQYKRAALALGLELGPKE